MIVIILLVIAAVLFLLASIGKITTPLHLGWFGAFFLTLAFVVERS